MNLADLQKELAASLAGRHAVPEGVEPEAVSRTRGSLEAKRRRAAGHLLPRLRTTLGASWAARFHEHAERYIPVGMLHHVDDSWALAEQVLRESEGLDPQLWRAAHDDLVSLRLRYERNPRQVALRIQERRGLLVAILGTPQRAVVVKLPGTPGRLWYLPI
jgi:hypothetical protein